MADSPRPQQNASVIADAGAIMDADSDLQRGRSSSEEKDSLTPAQSRRKAQNRAAYADKSALSASYRVLKILQTTGLPGA